MKIFKPQNEKGEKLVPLIIETEKIDNKYLDLTSISEQLVTDGSIKTELDSLDKRVESIEDTLDDEVDAHIKNSAIHFELANTVDYQSIKAVTGDAVIEYVESQDFADAEKVNEFESALQDLQGKIDEIGPVENLEKLATFFGEEDIQKGDNTLKDITDALDGITATNHPVQQEIKTDEPESTYAVSSKAVIGAIEEHAEDTSLHLTNNQAELIEGFFADRQPDGSIEEGETLDDILNKLDEHDSDIEQIETNINEHDEHLSNVDNDLTKIKNDLYGEGEVDVVVPLIADGAFNDSGHIIHLSQFNVKSIARSNIPNKFKSIIIHDVQNNWNNSTNPVEAEVRFGIDANNLKKKIVKARPVSNWSIGQNLEFELTEVVDAIKAGYDTFQFVIIDTTAANQQNNVPHVKYDNTKNITQWYGSCDLGVSNPWTAAQSAYAINISFKVTQAAVIGHLDNTDIHTSLAEKEAIEEKFTDINNKLDTLYPVTRTVIGTELDGSECHRPVSSKAVYDELNALKLGQNQQMVSYLAMHTYGVNKVDGFEKDASHVTTNEKRWINELNEIVRGKYTKLSDTAQYYNTLGSQLGTVPFIGCRIDSSILPDTINEVVLHDVQNNSPDNAAPIYLLFGVGTKVHISNPVTNWKTLSDYYDGSRHYIHGEDLHFSFNEDIEINNPQEIIISLIDNFSDITGVLTAPISKDKAPSIKVDPNTSLDGFAVQNPSDISTTSSNDKTHMVVNMSFGYVDGLVKQVNSKLDAEALEEYKAEVINTYATKSQVPSVVSTLNKTNTTNAVSGKAVADYVTTQINNIDVTLPDNIQCKSIEVTGNNINLSTYSYGNLDLGQDATISGNYQVGNVNLGYNSTISGGYQYGNVSLGYNSTISGGYQYGNVSLGYNSTISGGYQYSNQYGNVFAGCGFNISGDHTIIYNTWIIAGLSWLTNFESQVAKRYGLTLIGNAGDCGSTIGGNYRVYWPNVENYDAQIHGNTQWMSDHNIKDKNGNYIVQNGVFVGGSNITLDTSVTASSENGVTSKAIFNFVTTQVNEKVSIDEFGRTIAGLSDPESGLREAITEEITSAVTDHADNTSLHFDEMEKKNLGAVLNNYDGTTSIKKLVDDIDELKNSSGEATLPDNIKCKSLEVEGNNIDWSSDSYSNLDLGYNSTISGGEQHGNINLGYHSTISNGSQYGNINLGDESTIYSGEQFGNIILGNGATVSDGVQHGNILLGDYSTISGGSQYGNVISGANSTISDNCTTTRNTWIIAYLDHDTNFESQVTKRYGLTLIGTDDHEPPVQPYRVYWPDSNKYAAEQHGSLKCMEDFNLLDVDGNHIIQNGEFVAASDITIDNEVNPTSDNAVSGKAVSTYVSGQNFVKSLNAKEIRVYTDPDSAPPLEEREDGVLYLCKTTTEQKDYSSEIDELKQQIQALTEQLATYATQAYVNDNFIKGKVVDSEAEVEDKGEDYTYIIAPSK